MQQISVTQLIRYLKRKLDQDDNLNKVLVEGEISNYKRYASGHAYFTLKDEQAAISCVMFRSAVSALAFSVKEGDKVLVIGDTTIYENTGQLQLHVLKMQKAGLGDLYQRYEALKRKLSEQGKFDPEHKIALKSRFLRRVAILCGDSSAAMSDIRRAFQRRWPLCKTDYYPVLVQGNEAARDIISVLKQVDQLDYEAIILARGGGSFEDLFCFNDEELVNCIYDLNTFIVCGIGHEQDFTLADFVCDLRAATPTAAVELITPDIVDIIRGVDDLDVRLRAAFKTNHEQHKSQFEQTLKRLSAYHLKLSNLSLKIDNYITEIRNRIDFNISSYNNDLAAYESRMNYKLDLRLNEARSNFKRFTTLLQAYSAQNVLKRGYAIVFQDGRVIKRKEMLKKADFEVRFADGTIIAQERK